MTIATEFGNFGSFKDLSIFMHLEGKVSVFISSVEYFGCNCIPSSRGAILTIEEVDSIVIS